MLEDDDLLDRVNKVEALADQLACLEVLMRDKNVVIILSASYEYWIISLEMIPMKDLTMDYVMICLMYKMSKCKEKEPQGEDAVMRLRQNKYNNLFLRHGAKS